MDLRLALYELAAEHRLDRERTRQLFGLAALNDEAPGAARWLPRGVAVLGAALGGLGVVLWIAANWDTLGRFGRFALLQGFVKKASSLQCSTSLQSDRTSIPNNGTTAFSLNSESD